jgi:SAM-dependent methyltransferase
MKPEFWNQRFSQSDALYGLAPNVFFAAELAKLPPGRLLLPAEGQGRNAIHAARQGWEVTAFDYSSVARDKALALAAHFEVEIRYELMSYAELELAQRAYDAVGLVYAHMPPELRPEVHAQLAQSLRPGGTLILEGFHKRQLPLDSGGPKNEAMLFSEAELRADFAEVLAIEVLRPETVELDEGDYHQGRAEVLRLVGKRLADQS